MPAMLGLIACLACGAQQPVAAAEVDVALVLAVDVSQSMDEDELALQRAGYVAALRHPDFVRAVRAGRTGRVALAYFEWAGSVREDSLVGWQVVDGPAGADAFAALIADRPFGVFRGTSISGAIDFAASLLGASGFASERRVVDISGDGPNNLGAPVTDSRDAAVAGGIVVNGLPILIRPSPTFDHLDRYYAECVTGGPGSFVIPVLSVAEFSTAIRRKLILEVSGAQPPPLLLPAADTPIDCLQGERDRRLLADPYFPELDR